MSGVGKTLGKVASGVGKVASVAAPFLPGPWGAVAGIAGSMAQGSADQKQANQYNDQAGQITSAQSGAFNKYYQPVTDAFMQMNGYDPKTKKFNQVNPYGDNAGAANPYGSAANPYGANAGAANPYGTVSATPFGPTGGATPYGDNSQNPYTGALGSAQYNKTAEDVDASYDQALNQLGGDSLGRGFTGASGMADSARIAARTAEAGTLAGIRNDLAVKGADEQYRRGVANSNEAWNRGVQSSTEAWNRNAQNVNTAWNQTTAASDTAWGRNSQNVNMAWQQKTANEDAKYAHMANMLPMLSGQGAGAQQDLRGMGAQYASKAGNMGQQIGTLAGQVAQSGALSKVGGKVTDWLGGKLGVKRKQSTSLGTSTANAAPKPVKK